MQVSTRAACGHVVACLWAKAVHLPIRRHSRAGSKHGTHTSPAQPDTQSSVGPRRPAPHRYQGAEAPSAQLQIAFFCPAQATYLTPPRGGAFSHTDVWGGPTVEGSLTVQTEKSNEK